MKYILDKPYRLRGWYKLPYGLVRTDTAEVVFLDKQHYHLLLLCDGRHDFQQDELDAKDIDFLKRIADEGIIREAGPFSFLDEDQLYKAYPARFRKEVEWSITGACNLKCRHCFMSAPQAKHGNPTFEELVDVADQLAECGVFHVGITGGEPLIRTDFIQVVDALIERGIRLEQVYTNGLLVTEDLLDSLEQRGLRPSFHLSLDGIGWHDFLRGVEGAERKALDAIRLLKSRGFTALVAMSLHRKNLDSLRDTVNELASLGADGLKVSTNLELGEWADEDAADMKLTLEEELEAYIRYIPQYFDDGAPIRLNLSGAFSYVPGSDNWRMPSWRNCPVEQEGEQLACGVLGQAFYIGPDGMVAPCMGMCDTCLADILPNLRTTPLREVLRESQFVRLCYATVGEVRDEIGECRECSYQEHCLGGCRNNALVSGNGYFGVDTGVCLMFKEGWVARIRGVADLAYSDYAQKHPEMVTETDDNQRQYNNRVQECQSLNGGVPNVD